jgi:hypothetical protein
LHTFTPELVSLGYSTAENAATWLDIDQPVPASYAKQAALLSAPLGSNVGIQLEPELEPIFPLEGDAGYDFHLEGDLEDYIYLF